MAKVVCIAPGKDDTIVLVNHNENVKRMVENAIKEAWPAGIQRQEDQEVLGHTVHDIKMNGRPWWTSEANIDNNRIINRIVGNLSSINLRLVGGINIKGGTDSLFHRGSLKQRSVQFNQPLPEEPVEIGRMQGRKSMCKASYCQQWLQDRR